MQSDTRKILSTGILIFGAGVLAAGSVPLFFGGYTHQGPHTSAGWLALVVALGCLPTGILTLFLATLKLVFDRGR